MKRRTPAASRHAQAMECADRANRRRRTGNRNADKALFRQAAQHELAAADSLKQSPRHLGISVLLRSAACLARDAGDLDWARQIIARAQAADPHPAIAPELDDLLAQINGSGAHMA